MALLEKKPEILPKGRITNHHNRPGLAPVGTAKFGILAEAGVLAQGIPSPLSWPKGYLSFYRET